MTYASSSLPTSSSASSALPISRLLRNVLRADALASGAVGLLSVAAAGPLEALLGLPAALNATMGGVLCLYALGVALLARREAVSKGLLWALVGINLAWAIDCLVIAFGPWFAPNGLGIAFLGLQVVTVLVVAEFVVLALRRRR